jgi:hypothetical protein
MRVKEARKIVVAIKLLELGNLILSDYKDNFTDRRLKSGFVCIIKLIIVYGIIIMQRTAS